MVHEGKTRDFRRFGKKEGKILTVFHQTLFSSPWKCVNIFFLISELPPKNWIMISWRHFHPTKIISNMAKRTLNVLLLSGLLTLASANCPWSRDPRYQALNPHCACSAPQNTESATLSIQCEEANFSLLTSAMQSHTQDTIIEMLFVNRSAIGILGDFVFRNLKVINLQISNAGLIDVSANAFRGLENTLQNLNLAQNQLRTVPVEPLRQLRLVSLLDLSQNNIGFVPNNAFVTLRLKTLKMADNINLTMADSALRGLETSLKNLNLKGCSLKTIPEALRSLAGLAFLDLAQNNIRYLDPGVLARMNSLTALNLERNVIQTLHPRVFEGVTDTLSSLSLLNNLLTDYPTEAINSLKELRVREKIVIWHQGSFVFLKWVC